MSDPWLSQRPPNDGNSPPNNGPMRSSLGPMQPPHQDFQNSYPEGYPPAGMPPTGRTPAGMPTSMPRSRVSGTMQIVIAILVLFAAVLAMVAVAIYFSGSAPNAKPTTSQTPSTTNSESSKPTDSTPAQPQMPTTSAEALAFVKSFPAVNSGDFQVGNGWDFANPQDNTHCHISFAEWGILACDVKNGPNGGPCANGSTWFSAGKELSNDIWTLTCAGEPEWLNLPTLPYGKRLDGDSYSCAVTELGTTCVDQKGAGFTVSQNSYTEY